MSGDALADTSTTDPAAGVETERNVVLDMFIQHEHGKYGLPQFGSAVNRLILAAAREAEGFRNLTRVSTAEFDNPGPRPDPAAGETAAERALADVSAERARQIAKGYTPDHDDAHTTRELVQYALPRIVPAGYDVALASIDRKALVEAAAMLVAAIESIDRRAVRGTTSTGAETSDG